MASTYVPCPKCGSADPELTKFTWWGGAIGPRILTHVKCPSCRYKYNGKTGKDNTTGIVVYSLVVGLIAFVLMFSVFFLIAIR
jgi:rubredoxin